MEKEFKNKPLILEFIELDAEDIEMLERAHKQMFLSTSSPSSTFEIFSEDSEAVDSAGEENLVDVDDEPINALTLVRPVQSVRPISFSSNDDEEEVNPRQ